MEEHRRALRSYGILQVGLCALIVLALAASVVLTDRGSSGDATAAAASPAPTGSGTPATTTIAPATVPPGFPAAPVDDAQAEGELYGWGTAQPTQMRATVHYGGTSTLLARDRRQLLGRQLVQVRRTVMEIGTVAEAERLGFVRNFQPINGRGYEYINWDRFTSELDLTRPTMLAFEDDEPDSRVMSVAYNVLGTVEDGPPTDLPLEVIPWHYHSNLCEKDGSIIGSVEYDEDGVPYADQIERCESEGAVYRPELNHWMVDLWVVPGWENPWGLVSSKHPDMMFEPTPWFSSPSTGQAEGFGLNCALPTDAPLVTGPSDS